MQPIHVRRYQDSGHGYAGWVEPADRSWVLFLAVDGTPILMRRIEEAILGGHTEHRYIDVEISRSGMPPDAAISKEPMPANLTFEVSEQPDGAFCARLGQRDIAADGTTRDEAITGLLNYVAQLCTAGCLDPTGEPVPGVSPRRQAAVSGS